MELYLEALTEAAGQFARIELRLEGRQFLEMLAHRWGKLARAFRTPFMRQQALQPVGLELVLRLVEGGARQTELGGGANDRIAVGADRAQGFVFELEQVLGIEKIGVLKQRVADLSGAGVESAGGLQGLAFGLGSGVGGHECKYIYAE